METDKRLVDYDTLIDYDTLAAKMQYGRKLRSQYTVETIIRVYKRLQGLFNRWHLEIQTQGKKGVRHER